VIEGAGGWLYHRLLAGRSQERDMTYNFGSGYWWKVAVGGSSGMVEPWLMPTLLREWECERRLISGK
jgi:hypothetical protein